jgi:hypothetical protein
VYKIYRGADVKESTGLLNSTLLLFLKLCGRQCKRTDEYFYTLHISYINH